MAGSLELQVRQDGVVGIVTAKGYINNTGGEQVAQACETLMGKGVCRLVLNLERTNMVNSMGASFLIEAIEKAKGRGGQVAFCGLSPTIAKTFQIMGLLQLATLHETEQEAVQALSSFPSVLTVPEGMKRDRSCSPTVEMACILGARVGTEVGSYLVLGAR